jgi:23S rRNA (uracil1939-C5)-methyltransferase
MAELTGKERVLDLYCGNGNFSLAAAARSSIVTGLEEFAPSIDDARRNALKNGVENVSFDAVDAVRGVRRLVDSRTAVDLVILDPPRAGAADCVKLLPGLGAARIVYVSCDPPTLARDLSILAAGGYSVVKSRPVDMFPQTYHIESVTLLEINRHDRRSRQWG